MVQVPDEYFETEGAVYKFYCGDKYVIIKGQNLMGSLHLFEKGYAAFLSTGGGNRPVRPQHQQWDDKNSFYFKIYTFIQNNPNQPRRIEVLFESNNGYQLLKREQQELNKSIKDKNCLNNNVTAYIPKFRVKTNSYGWITKRQVADFRRFLAS